MQIEGHNSITFDRLVDGTSRKVWDVLGPTVEFLIPPEDPDAHFCVMRGVVPPG
jgi:hypothetical protein